MTLLYHQQISKVPKSQTTYFQQVMQYALITADRRFLKVVRTNSTSNQSSQKLSLPYVCQPL